MGKLAYGILKAEEIAIGGPNKDYARVGMERNRWALEMLQRENGCSGEQNGAEEEEQGDACIRMTQAFRTSPLT